MKAKASQYTSIVIHTHIENKYLNNKLVKTTEKGHIDTSHIKMDSLEYNF